MKNEDTVHAVLEFMVTVIKWAFWITFGLLWVLFVLMGDKSKNRD